MPITMLEFLRPFPWGGRLYQTGKRIAPADFEMSMLEQTRLVRDGIVKLVQG